MRRFWRMAAPFGLVLALGGCSGFGHFWRETLTFPGANPNGPIGESENIVRARGGSIAAVPLLPQPGNIWPGPPQALPSLADVESNHGLAAQLGNPATFYGGSVLTGPQLGEGGSMSVGEQDGIAHGVRDFSDDTPAALPNHERDDAVKYGARARTGTISIPNGDGTTTLIAPNGSVRVVKDGRDALKH